MPAMEAASSTALAPSATLMPMNSAAAAIGIIPSGITPWVIIMMAMTRPRISGRMASVVTLMFSEPTRDPKAPMTTPKAAASSNVEEKAKPARPTAHK